MTPWLKYKGYTIRFEYGGWGVAGTLFKTRQAAKLWVDAEEAKQ